MKTNRLLSFFAIVTLALAFTSCVQDDDYTVPNSLGTEENARLNTLLGEIEAGTTTLLSIQDVKGLYQNQTPAFVETSIALKGYVSSSDQTGNFFKEIFIQDAPENPTAGIKIILNQVETYNQYNFGREVYIKLTGLYVGEERVGTGVIAIGGTTQTDNFGTTVERMTENQRLTHMFRSENTATIIPKTLTFSEVGNSHIGLFVQFENVEFADNLNGLRYFDPIQDFDTSRSLQSCSGFSYTNFNLETSSFSNFKDVLLPTGNGTISGVIAKTFNGSSLIMALNDINDVNLTGPRCSILNIDDFNVVFQDGFATGISNWTTFNVVGTQVWGQTNFGNPAPSAYMNGFQSGAQTNDDWLISPSIDLSGVTNTVFFFETDKRYDGNDLEAYYSTDYTGGNPTTNGTWIQVDAVIDPNAAAFSTWTNSGTIDISSADGGSVFIAFRYTSTTTAASTFELDNVKVLGL